MTHVYLRAPMLLLLAAAAACDPENTLNKVSDTGAEEEAAPEEPGECLQYECFAPQYTDELDTGTTGVVAPGCYFHLELLTPCATEISSLIIVGEGDMPAPGALAFELWDSNKPTDDPTNLFSDPMTPTTTLPDLMPAYTTATWYAPASEGSFNLGTINDCPDIGIADVPRMQVVQVLDSTVDKLADCSKYDRLEVCIDYRTGSALSMDNPRPLPDDWANIEAWSDAIYEECSGASGPPAPPPSSGSSTSSGPACQPGTGTVLLVPNRVHWKEGLAQVDLAPVQLSGTGRLTASALMQHTHTVSGPLARVVNGASEWMPADPTAPPTGAPPVGPPPNLPPPGGAPPGGVPGGVPTDIFPRSALLSTTGGGFPGGTRLQDLQFQLEDLAMTSPAVAVTSMTWTCDGAQSPTPPDTGYTFGLDDVGCAFDIPQSFRLGVGDGQVRLTLAGQSARYGVAAKLDQDEFVLEHGALGLAGWLGVPSVTGGPLPLHLSEVTWSGVPICTPGTYFLPPETGAGQ